MPSIATPDLRPLQQPLGRSQLRAAKLWLRQHRQLADVPGIGLAIAGWVMAVPAALIVLVGASSPGELEMVVVGSVMLAIGVALLVWRTLRRRDALRRAARLIAFADANGFAYAQRMRPESKPASLLREGFDRVGLDVLRAPDGAEWGVWRHRDAERRGTDVLRGYLELPWSGSPTVQLDGGPPVGLLDLLREAPLPLDLQMTLGRLTIVARRSWRMADPEVQMLVHRIRALVADQSLSSAQPMPAMPVAIASAPGSRRDALVALGSGLLLALFYTGWAFLQAYLRNAI